MGSGQASTAGAELDRYLRGLEAREAFAGVVRITVDGAERFAGAYGYASRAWRVPNALETRFDTASITKLFTAVAALQQVEAGASREPVLGSSATSASTARPSRPDVTVRHLLTHTSGIGDDADEEAGERYEDSGARGRTTGASRPRTSCPSSPTGAPNFEPGAGCRYNNCAYVLLGLMIERATGETYRDVVRERVFAPAGMTDSDFLRMDRVTERLAEGADPVLDDAGAIVGWKRSIYSYPPIGSPDGGAHVTAADLERFLRAVTGGRLLSAAMTTAFLTPQVVYRVRAGWTQHWGCDVVPDRRLGRAGLPREGGRQCRRQRRRRHYPGRDLTLVVLSNLEDGARDSIERAHEAIMQGAFA